MLTYSEFSNLYPNLALFTKERGWRCGKSFISWRSKCYTNPKTGKKLGYKYQINPKTGRRRKVRIGLNYKEYQKARTKAVKKKGQGKKLTTLEQKYIADTQRLATSTRKKKQRRVDARNKRRSKVKVSEVQLRQEAGKYLGLDSIKDRETISRINIEAYKDRRRIEEKQLVIDGKYRKAQKDWKQLFDKQSTRRSQLTEKGLSNKEILSDPEYQQLNKQVKQKREVRVKYHKQTSDLTGELFANNKILISPQPKKTRKRKTEAEKLIELKGKRDRQEQRLENAKTNKIIADSETKRLSKGSKDSYLDEVQKSFPLGMVGSSGKNTKSLNRKRARSLDKTIDDAVASVSADKKAREANTKVKIHSKKLARLDEQISSLESKSNQGRIPEQGYGIDLNKYMGLWKDGKPYKTGKTRAESATLLKTANPETIDAQYKIVESVDNDRQHKKYRKQIQAIADKAGYEVVGDKKNVVIKGTTMPITFYYSLKRKSDNVDELEDKADQAYWDFSRRSNVNPGAMVEARTKISKTEEAQGKARIWNRSYSKKSENVFGYKNQTVHKRQVERAIASGKTIPDNVLGQYPDLKLIHKDNKPLHTVTKQEYINEFPGTRKKVLETYGDVEFLAGGDGYVIMHSDREKGLKGTTRGTGKTLKEAAYSFAVRNKLSPDHFHEVRDAVNAKKPVSIPVLKDYGNAFILEIDRLEELQNEKPRTKPGNTNSLSNLGKFTTPEITTARQDLVKKAIAKRKPSEIPQELKPHLTDKQQLAVGMGVSAMETQKGFLLADGTGVGKTRSQLATAKIFADSGKKVLIVSKAEVLKPKWRKSGNNEVSGSFKEDAETMGIEYKVTKDGKDIKPGEIGLSTYSNVKKLKESVDKDTTLIFDEAHSFKNEKSARTQHGMQMIGKADSVMYATATPADKPEHIDYLFKAGVFNGNTKEQTYKWLGMEQVEVSIGYGRKVYRWQKRKDVTAEEMIDRLNGLFDSMTENGNMLKREISLKGVETKFKQVSVPQEARDALNRIESAYSDRKDSLAKAQMLMHQRRQLEPYKVPAAVEMVKDAIAQGRKPVIFVSRVNESTVVNPLVKKAKTMEDLQMLHSLQRQGIVDLKSPASSEGTAKLLREALKKEGITKISEIHGGSKEKPDKAMKDFQSGKTDVVIATVESGGTGINLDDRDGDKPRSLIMLTPPFSAVENVQAAGRVWRLKTKSYPEINYIFSDTSVDTWNRNIISKKMKSLGAVVSGEIGKLDADNAKSVDKIAGTTKKSPRIPEGSPEVKIPKGFYVNKYPGYTRNGQKVAKGEGFIRREKGRWITYSREEIMKLNKSNYTQGISYAQFSNLYPNLALFTKERGWRCGKSFISYRSRCYTNPRTGKKTGYRYEINPKTGRKRKVRIGLTYKEYQKARTKAVKKRGQGKKLSGLEQKYIADTQRLATSTRKKKQRRLDAKNKRKGIKSDLAKGEALRDRLKISSNKSLEQLQKEADTARNKNLELIARAKAGNNYNPGQVNIPQYLRSMNQDLSKSLGEKLKEFDRLGIPAFTILETEGKRDKQTIFALNKKGEATVYRSKEKRRYAPRYGNDYEWVESKYLHSNKKRKTLAKRSTDRFFPKAEELDRVAYNESFRKIRTKQLEELKTKQAAIAKQKELEELTRKADSRKRSGFIDYLDSAAKSIKGKKGEFEAPVSVRVDDQSSKREIKKLKVDATFYGANGEFAYHPSFSKTEAAAGVKVLSHVKTGAKLYRPQNQKEAKQMVYQILNSGANLDVDDPKKFTPEDLSKITKAISSVKYMEVPDNFDPDNPPEIRNFNPQKKRRSKKKVEPVTNYASIAERIEAEKAFIAKRRKKIRRLKLDINIGGKKTTRNLQDIDFAAGNFKYNSKKQRQFNVTFIPESTREAGLITQYLTEDQLIKRVPGSKAIIDELKQEEKLRLERIKANKKKANYSHRLNYSKFSSPETHI